jgi:hypothetical protein
MTFVKSVLRAPTAPVSFEMPSSWLNPASAFIAITAKFVSHESSPSMRVIIFLMI